MVRPIPHDYQVDAIDATRDYIVAGIRRVVIVAPTGAGKTTIAAEIIASSVEKGCRVLFLAHRAELIDQASKRLDRYGIDHGIIQAGTTRSKRFAQVQVASIQTLVRRQLPPADLVIVDEAHRAKAKSYLEVLAAYPEAVTLGLTATPWRMDGTGLGDIFQAMVQVCQPRDLIEREPAVLVRCRVFAPVTPNLVGVKTSRGDFEQGALQAVMATEASVDEIVRNWQKYASDRPTVAFATGVAHSLMIRDAFRAIGVTAEHIDGQTHKDDRANILAGLAAGRVQLVTNCEVLTEGWDSPGVSCAIMARPTQSLSLYLQMAGRVLRAAPSKADAIMLDHAGNCGRHGFPADDREWNLEGRKKKPKGETPVKTCPECYACVPSSTGVCPECKTAFVVESRASNEKTVVNRDLVELAADLPPLPRLERRDRWLEPYRVQGRPPEPEEKQALYDELARRCIDGGRKTGWIYHKYRLVFGVAPGPAVRKGCYLAEQLAAKKDAEKATAWGLNEEVTA